MSFLLSKIMIVLLFPARSVGWILMRVLMIMAHNAMKFDCIKDFVAYYTYDQEFLILLVLLNYTE